MKDEHVLSLNGVYQVLATDQSLKLEASSAAVSLYSTERRKIYWW